MTTVVWTNEDLTGNTTYSTGGVIDASNTSVGSGATWLVEGTVNQTSGLNLSDTSTGPWEVGFLSIAKTGVYNITDDSGITCNYTSGGTVTNAGLLTTAGTATANISVATTNTGTIDVNSGALAFGASVNNSGTIADKGTGLGFNAGLTNTGTITAGSVGLTISGGYTNTGAISLTGGTLTLNNGGAIDSHFSLAASVTIALNSGAYTFAGTTLTEANLVDTSGATLSLASGQKLTLSANDTLGSTDVTGAGELITTGTIAESNDSVGSGATWLVEGTVNQTSGLNLSDTSTGPWEVGFLSIAKTGVYNITDDSGITCNYTSGGTVTNAGLLTTAGTATANISVATTNTGTIDVNSGALAFGASVNNSGTIADKGTGLGFNAGLTNTGTITAGSVGLTISGGYTNTGAISLTGGTLTLNNGGAIDSHFSLAASVTIALNSGAYTFAGTTLTEANLVDTSGATLSLASGQKLTLSANDTLGSTDVTGAGELITTGVIPASGLSVGSGATWLVDGTVNQTSGLNLSDTSTGPWEVGFLSIAKTGVYNITDDSGITCNYTSGGTVTNAGLLTTAGTATANISVATTNTGTIDVNSGALAFGASVNNSGTIADKGTGLGFNAGLTNTGTITAGSVGLTISGGYTNTGAISLTGGTLTLNNGGAIDSHFSLAASVTIALNSGAYTFAGTTLTEANLVDTSGATLSLASGQKLTLSANDTLGSTDVTGAGELITTGVIPASGLSVGSGATWLVEGTVNQTSGLNLSDTSTGPWEVGFLSIAKTGVYNITDDSGITCNYTSGGTVTNAGLLTTAGTATANISVATTNTGTIDVNSGALAFGASVNNSGTIADKGTGLGFNAGLTNTGTITAGSVGLTISGGYTNTGAISLTGGTLTLNNGGAIDSHFSLAASVTIALNSGAYTFAGTTLTEANLVDTSGATLSLASGQKLTLSANDTLGSTDVTGAGELITTGVIPASGLSVGSGATWLVEGTVNQTSGLNLSDTSTGPWEVGFLSIAKTGVYNITDDSGITCNYTSGGTVTNAGLLTTAGTATANISVATTNTGTIDVNSGALAFGASVNNSGTIADKGTGLGFNAGLTNTGTITAGSVGLTISGGYTNTGAISLTGGTLTLNNGGAIDSHFSLAASVTIALNSGAYTFAGTTLTEANLVDTSGATLSLASGQKLTLSANDTLGSTDVTGAGELITTGTIAESSDSVGSGATWLVEGTVNQTSGLNLSDTSTGPWEVGFLSIAKTGVYNITDDSGITCNYTSGGTVTNAGLLTTAGTATANISVATTNTGTIDVKSGTLAFGAALTNSGTLEAVGGNIGLQAGAELDGVLGAAKSAGAIQLNGGAFTTAKTATVADEGAAENVLVNGTTWTVSGSVTDDGEVGLANSSSSLVIASGGSWTLASADAGFSDPSSFVTNNGTLAVSGATVKLTANLVNNKLIDVKSGDLILDTPTFLSGTGALQLEAGASMELASDPGPNQTLHFNGANGTLQIDTPSSMTASIAGFGIGDAIKLMGVTANAAKVNTSNQLVVTENGTTVATYNLSGANSGFAYVVKAVTGGVEILAPPVPATVAEYLAYTSAYDSVSNGFAISDTAANISAHLNSLNDTHITKITISDNGAVGVSVAQVTSDAKAISKLADANGKAYQLAVVDTAADVSAGLGTLNTANIGSITVSDNSTVGVNVAALTSDAAAIAKLVNANATPYQLAVTDTGADISADLSGLDGSSIGSIIISDNAAITLAVADVANNAAAVAKLANANGTPVALAVVDTAANISAALSSLNVANVALVTISDNGAIGVNVAALTSDAAAIAKLANANGQPYQLAVTDTAADIAAGAGTLEADVAHIGSITSTGGLATVSTSVFAVDAGALNKIVGGFAVSDSLPKLIAALAVVQADPAVVAITGSSGVATLSSGVLLNVATTSLTGSGTKLTVSETLSYAGALSVGAGAAISVSTGDVLTLNGAASVNGAIGGAGELVTDGASITLSSTAGLTTMEWASTGETINLTSARTFAGYLSAGAGDTFDASGGALTLTQDALLSGGVTLDGAYAVAFYAETAVDGTLLIGGAGADIGATLTDSGGAATLGDAAGDVAKLTITTGGSWDFIDDSSLLLGASSASYIANQGALEKSAGAGVSEVAAAVTNTGDLAVSSGVLEFAGAISGAGAETIEGQATLQLGATVAAGQTVTFVGSQGTLELLDPQGFAGKIAGFDVAGGSSDEIELSGSWSLTKFLENPLLTSGTMTLSNGATTATLTLVGAHAGADFSLSSGIGGTTLIKYV